MAGFIIQVQSVVGTTSMTGRFVAPAFLILQIQFCSLQFGLIVMRGKITIKL